MSRFTVAIRQRIVEDFCRRHNGQFDAKLFFEEVRTDAAHEAHDWFNWDRDEAAYQFNLAQARQFAHGLKVSFTVETVGGGSFTLDAPLVVSPVEGRRHGGGYFLTGEDHIAELSHQGASALRSWIARYKICLQRAGLTSDALEHVAQVLEGVSSRDAA